MSDISLRSLHPDDLDTVVAIDNDIVGRSRRTFFEKRLQLALESPDTLVTCAAVADEKLIGYCFVRIEEGAFGIVERVGVVDVIGVDTNYQKAGVGMLMMEELERRLLQKSISSIRTSIRWSDTGLVSYFSAAGFQLFPGMVLNRSCEVQPSFVEGDPEASRGPDGANREVHDVCLARSMVQEDLPALIRIDSKLTDRNRTNFFQSKMQEMLNESGIRVSLVVERGGAVVGYAMARLDYGDFGRVEPAAVLDTLGVHPDYTGQGLGRTLLWQLLGNLAALQVNSVSTQLQWQNVSLLAFFDSCDFQPTQDLLLTKPLS